MWERQVGHINQNNTLYIEKYSFLWWSLWSLDSISGVCIGTALTHKCYTCRNFAINKGKAGRMPTMIEKGWNLSGSVQGQREIGEEHGDLYVREEMRRPGPDLRTQWPWLSRTCVMLRWNHGQWPQAGQLPIPTFIFSLTHSLSSRVAQTHAFSL